MFQVSPALKNFWIDRDSFMVDDTKSSGNWWGRRAETPATGSLQRNEGGSSQIMSSRPSLRPSEPKRFFWYGMMMEGEGFVGPAEGINILSDMPEHRISHGESALTFSGCITRDRQWQRICHGYGGSIHQVGRVCALPNSDSRSDRFDCTELVLCQVRLSVPDINGPGTQLRK